MQEAMKFRAKRKTFNIIRSTAELARLLPRPPDTDECYKAVSYGGFSSISFVRYVAGFAKIDRLFAASLRIGKKEARELFALHRAEKLGECTFIIGKIMQNDKKTDANYGYFRDFENICRLNSWRYVTVNNHAKIILMDTKIGKFVLETSANLNENPKIEQFSFENDAGLFSFYERFFEEAFE